VVGAGAVENNGFYAVTSQYYSKNLYTKIDSAGATITSPATMNCYYYNSASLGYGWYLGPSSSFQKHYLNPANTATPPTGGWTVIAGKGSAPLPTIVYLV
jgi:hypothetical protein